MYVDPTMWTSELAGWQNKHGGRKMVKEFDTAYYREMAKALREYAAQIEAGSITNDGDPVFARHIGNAHKVLQNFRDDDDTPLWIIRKDRPLSPNKIDAAMAGCLANAARNDAIAAGARARGPVVPPGYSEQGDDPSRYDPAMAGIRTREF